MVDPTPMPGLEEKIRRVDERFRSGGNGGGDGAGPTGDDMEHRVRALEKSVEKIDAKLDKIIEAVTASRVGAEQRFGSISERLASIDVKLDMKASAAELAEVKGRVALLPTTWQMITLVVGTVFTILGGSFLILRFGLPHAP